MCFCSQVAVDCSTAKNVIWLAISELTCFWVLPPLRECHNSSTGCILLGNTASHQLDICCNFLEIQACILCLLLDSQNSILCLPYILLACDQIHNVHNKTDLFVKSLEGILPVAIKPSYYTLRVQPSQDWQMFLSQSKFLGSYNGRCLERVHRNESPPPRARLPDTTCDILCSRSSHPFLKYLPAHIQISSLRQRGLAQLSMAGVVCLAFTLPEEETANNKASLKWDSVDGAHVWL